MKDRADSWSPEDDLILATVVISHIKEGTQLKGFAEAGSKLGRTHAACGFHWNSVVRKQYKEEIETAKQEKRAARSKRQEQGKVKLTAKQLSQSSYEAVLRELTTSLQKIRRLEDESASLKAQLNEKDQLIQSLENQIRANRTPEQVVNDDFHTFMSIMKRARDLGVLAEHRLSESS